MDVRLPDGTVIQGVPDNITKAELTAKLAKNGYDVSKLSTTSAPQTSQQDAPRTIASIGAGLGKGFGDVALGAQGLVGKGLQKLGEAVTPDQQSISGLVRGTKDRGLIQSAGDWLVNDAQAGRNKLADELAPYKDAHPLAAGAGEVGGNVIATLPVGGFLAGGVRAAAPVLTRAGASSPLIQRLANAVETAGFRTGAPAATTVAGKAADLGVRAAGGGITGGTSAALVDPEHAASGAVVGAAIPPALMGAGKVAGYTGNALRALIQPFTDPGQSAIAANILKKFGDGGPMAVNVAELVPGSRPTLAEATGNAGIAGLQRSARDLRPNAFVEREQGNALARLAAFDRVAGDKTAIEAASTARDNAADALYGRAFAADAMRRSLAQEAQAMRAPFSGVGLSGAAEDLATPGLRALMARPDFRAAADSAKRLAANYGVKLDDPLQSLEGLHYIKLALDDALNPASKSAMGRNASSAVMDMRDKLAAELAKVSPLYGNARQTFADMSQPINAMEALQGLRLTDARGNMTLSKVQNALASLDKTRAAPGVAPAKSISDEQMATLGAIRADLLRQDALNTGRSVGSNTFQNISTNNILANLLPGRLGTLAEQKAGGVVGQLGRLLYSGPNEAIRNRLVDMLLDPASAEQALTRQQSIAGPSALERLLQSQSVGQPIARIAPVAAANR